MYEAGTIRLLAAKNQAEMNAVAGCLTDQDRQTLVSELNHSLAQIQGAKRQEMSPGLELLLGFLGISLFCLFTPYLETNLILVPAGFKAITFLGWCHTIAPLIGACCEILMLGALALYGGLWGLSMLAKTGRL